jgi:hypothetical protein
MSLGQALSMTFLMASLALPTVCWASPLTFCAAPSTSRFGWPTALPTPCVKLPAASLATPLILSVVLLLIGVLKD